MKNRQGVAILLGVLALGSILAMTSCGPSVDLTGWSNGGNTDGTGTGPVTGFGSVIVNGVKYDDTGIDNTSFFDDHGRTKTELMAGMMVKVTATGVNDVSGTGTATKIEVLRHVDGPMDDNGVDLATNRLRVMGQSVVSDTTTVFDNVVAGGLIELAAIDNLVKAGKRPEFEIHGIADNTGTIHATFIHMWFDNVATGRDVQVRGTVANLNPTRTVFTLGTISVNISTPPVGLANGLFVEVKGTFRISDNTLLATGVTIEDPTAGQSAGDLVKAEGYVNRIISATQFELVSSDGSQTVNWSTATTAFKDGTVADLVAGARIEVEGKRNLDKTVAAAEISLRKPSNIRMDTVVTAKTPPAGTQSGSLTLFGKTVFVNALTQYTDSSSASLQTFGFNSIGAPPSRSSGDNLVVSAYIDNSTGTPRIIASRVERVDALASNRNILQGVVENPSTSPTLTVMGITVTTTAGATGFLQSDNTPFPSTGVLQQNNFFAALTVGRTVVKAKGTFGPWGISADEVQIEPTIDN
ncbi:MAG: DUF5666 domain-containing protein [Candidatus Deferrimicrobium sp.]|nr:DUF5666 domain-containing protein [Candidatus Deferrimicrobium sp.]